MSLGVRGHSSEALPVALSPELVRRRTKQGLEGLWQREKQNNMTHCAHKCNQVLWTERLSRAEAITGKKHILLNCSERFNMRYFHNNLM